MKEPELTELATKLVMQAAKAGCKGVIVALSSEHEGHSEWTMRAHGQCLELEGLASHIPQTLAALWPVERKVLTPPAEGSVDALIRNTLAKGEGISGSGGR